MPVFLSPFFPLSNLILHSFHFDVAKKELFQDTQGDTVFNHSTTVQMCVEGAWHLLVVVSKSFENLDQLLVNCENSNYITLVTTQQHT